MFFFRWLDISPCYFCVSVHKIAKENLANIHHLDWTSLVNNTNFLSLTFANVNKKKILFTCVFINKNVPLTVIQSLSIQHVRIYVTTSRRSQRDWVPFKLSLALCNPRCMTNPHLCMFAEFSPSFTAVVRNAIILRCAVSAKEKRLMPAFVVLSGVAFIK